MVITLENMLLSNMFMNPLPRISSFNYLTNSVGPGEPVKMDGEISVVQAKADSREMKKNEIGVEIDRHKIQLEHPIKTTGEHEVRIKLHHDVTANFRFEVRSSEEPKAEAAPAELAKSRTEKRRK